MTLQTLLEKKSIKVKQIQKSTKILKSTRLLKSYCPEISSLNSLSDYFPLGKNVNKKKVGFMIFIL